MIPNLMGALRGWTRKRAVKIVTLNLIGGLAVEASSNYNIAINIQPMPSEKVMRKPEEQRIWKWYEIFAPSVLSLKIDDRVIADKTYKICEVYAWDESKFRRYEAIEDYVPGSY